MKLVKTENDKRGIRYIFHKNNKIITIFEIKNGFARGGQYHEQEVIHILISGKIQYTKKNVYSNIETTEIVSPLQPIILPPFTSDLIIGLEDSILLGIYPIEKSSMYFKEHRKEVKKRINFNNTKSDLD